MVKKPENLCPDCGDEEIQFRALVANKAGQRYAVGLECYRKQWAEKYGDEEKCPV